MYTVLSVIFYFNGVFLSNDNRIFIQYVQRFEKREKQQHLRLSKYFSNFYYLILLRISIKTTQKSRDDFDKMCICFKFIIFALNNELSLFRNGLECLLLTSKRFLF